ncbi:MAG: aldo/keto reductase [Proteobacteria bacterium]|nr:aldo/keto reductase [Pseudomonadota bacterium]
MKRRRLGRSALDVSEICLGTMTFGSMADEAVSLRILDTAFDAGVNFLDVAETYPVPPDPKWVGRSEEICGKWLQARPRDSVIVATKVAGPPLGWFQTPIRSGNTGLDRHHVERALEASLRRLGTDYVDLYQTHWPDPDLPIDETLEALDRAVEEGKVRYVGCSNQTAYGLTKSLWAADKTVSVRYETIQNNFSLLNRRFEDELAEVCRREQVSLLPYSPLAGGVLSGKYQGGSWPEGARFTRYKEDPVRGAVMARRFVNERTLSSVERFTGIAREHGLGIATFATAWTLAHDFVASTIIGATSVEQLEETLPAAEVSLSVEALSACNKVSRDIRYPMG